MSRKHAHGVALIGVGALLGAAILAPQQAPAAEPSRPPGTSGTHGYQQLVPSLSTGVANIRDFGAWGAVERATGSVHAGSHGLRVDMAREFQVGLNIDVAHAGTPAVLATPNVTASIIGASATVTRSYRVAAVSAAGGQSVSSLAVAVNASAETLSGKNYVSLEWDPIASATAYVIYGSVNGGSFTFYDYTANSAWNDTGAHQSTVPRAVSPTPTDAALAETLSTTVAAVRGSKMIQLADAAQTTVSNVPVLHDDTIAIDRAIDRLSALGGGVLFVPAGNYITSGVRIPDNGRISIVGVSSGVSFRTTANINDYTNVSRLTHRAGSQGPLIEYAPVSVDHRTSLYTGGMFRLTNLLLVGGPATSDVVRLDHVTRQFELDNLFIDVSDSNMAGQGLELYESWTGMINNVSVFHGAQNGAKGPASTGVGVKIWNDASIKQGNAINQLVVNNLFSQWFKNGIEIGTESTGSARSQYLNSLVFNGGAVQMSGDTGIWVGQGAEAISFRGVHIEKSGHTGLYVGEGATNVAFRDAMVHQDSDYVDKSGSARDDGKEIWIADASNVQLDNVVFSNVGETGVYIGAGARHTTLDQLTFAPHADNHGVAIFSEARTSSDVHLGAGIRFNGGVDRSGNPISFASEISGPGGYGIGKFWSDSDTAYQSVVDSGSIELSVANGTVFNITSTSATTVTKIHGGVPGKSVVIAFSGGNTTVQSSRSGPGSILLAGGTGHDFHPTKNSTLTLVQMASGVWFETARTAG